MLCMAGLTLAFAAMALSVALGSVWLLLLSRLVSGLLGGSMAIGQAAIIDLSTDDTKAVNLGRITIANAMGHFLGPAIGAALADQHLYLPFICIAGLAMVSFGWIGISLKETRTKVDDVRINWLRPVSIFLEAFRNRKIRQLSIAYLLFHAGNSMSYQHLYIFLAETKGYTPGELTLFSTLAIGSGALFCTFWLLAKLQKLFSAMTLSVVPLVISGLVSILFAQELPDWLYWVAGFCWAIFLITAYVSTIKLYSDCVSDDMQGWAMGVAGSVFAFSFVVGGLSASLLYWFRVSALLSAGGFLLIASGLYLYMKCNFHH